MKIKAKRGEIREMRGDVNGKVFEIKIYEAKICVCATYTLKHYKQQQTQKGNNRNTMYAS